MGGPRGANPALSVFRPILPMHVYQFAERQNARRWKVERPAKDDLSSVV